LLFSAVAALALPAVLGVGHGWAEQAAGPATLGLADLRELAAATRSRIEDLSVSYSFNAVKGPMDPDYRGHRYHAEVVVKGAKLYLSTASGAHEKYGQPLLRRQAAYNGKRSIHYVQPARSAGITGGRSREATTKGEAFFDLMLLNPPDKDGHGVADQNLLSLLGSDRARLRERLEPVDGRLCHVVDLVRPRDPRIRLTVWLDAQRGCLPLRQRYFGGQDLQTVTIEFEVLEAIELRDGLWFPIEATKKVRWPHNPPDAPWVAEHILSVDSKPDGTRAIAANSGVPDEFFDLWKRLPPGTYVADMDVGASWTVGGSDLEALAGELTELVDGVALPVPERSADQQPAQPLQPLAASPSKRQTQQGSAEPGGISLAWPIGISLAVVAVGAVAAAAMSLRKRRHAD
jgi:hypothetical protein